MTLHETDTLGLVSSFTLTLPHVCQIYKAFVDYEGVETSGRVILV